MLKNSSELVHETNVKVVPFRACAEGKLCIHGRGNKLLPLHCKGNPQTAALPYNRNLTNTTRFCSRLDLR